MHIEAMKALFDAIMHKVYCHERSSSSIIERYIK